MKFFTYSGFAMIYVKLLTSEFQVLSFFHIPELNNMMIVLIMREKNEWAKT